jgi:hypothetical protein
LLLAGQVVAAFVVSRRNAKLLLQRALLLGLLVELLIALLLIALLLCPRLRIAADVILTYRACLRP